MPRFDQVQNDYPIDQFQSDNNYKQLQVDTCQVFCPEKKIKRGRIIIIGKYSQGDSRNLKRVSCVHVCQFLHLCLLPGQPSYLACQIGVFTDLTVRLIPIIHVGCSHDLVRHQPVGNLRTHTFLGLTARGQPGSFQLLGFSRSLGKGGFLAVTYEQLRFWYYLIRTGVRLGKRCVDLQTVGLYTYWKYKLKL